MGLTSDFAPDTAMYILPKILKAPISANTSKQALAKDESSLPQEGGRVLIQKQNQEQSHNCHGRQVWCMHCNAVYTEMLCLGLICSGHKVADVCMLMVLSSMCYVMLTLQVSYEQSQPGSAAVGSTGFCNL